ncbi:MAG TPA: DNA polymerase III subunit gamma/tau [Bacillota bacterium]|nr:DNA polymerase III subunit gamma/tau [Bacillota bacterium]
MATYQALYRSFRPEIFDDLLGQEHIVTILRNQIKSGTVAHAYLFCGTRGTGKTTTARLLAKALNCLSDGERPCGECEACRAIANGSFLDVIEIDAASNNGVDDIRDLRESVNFPPAYGRNKVYIIDEAHMLSGPASNALLKTLEEPPTNVVFILATTEPNKLPPTVLSRCLRMDFRRIPEEKLIGRFSEICEGLGVKASKEALALIASNADGSARDGLSLLDRCIAGTSSLERSDVLFLLGITGAESLIEMTDCIIRADAGNALSLFADVLSDGKEASQFARDWMEHLRNLIIIKYMKNPENVLNLSLENIARLREQCSRADTESLRGWIVELARAISDAKWSPRPRILIELAIVRMAAGEGNAPQETGATETTRKEGKSGRRGPESGPKERARRVNEPENRPKESEKPSEREIDSEELQSGAKEAENSFRPKDSEPLKKDEAPRSPVPVRREFDVEDFGSVENMSAAEMSEIRESIAEMDKSESLNEKTDDERWDEVLHDASVPIQLQMSGAALYSVEEKDITILVSNSVTENRFKTNAAMFENLIETAFGRRLKLHVKVVD